MPGLSGWRLPVVVPPVFVADWRFCQLLARSVVQACDVDCVKVATEHIQVASPERLDTATAAEEVVYGVAAELIVRQSVLSLQQPERIGFDDGFPVPRLGADRAVALARTLGQVDLTFEADGTAVAASGVCLLSHWCPSS